MRERAKENGGDQRNWDRVLDDWDQDREIGVMMEGFRRYAQAYLRQIDHPFGSGLPMSPSPAELEEMINFATWVLAAPVRELRLANLDVRFESSVDQYLVVSRD